MPARRTSLVDTLVTGFWYLLGGASRPIALVAIGGYGRRELFPYSDIDLMFLCADARVEASARELIRSISQTMWDSGLRASTVTRSRTRMRAVLSGEFGVHAIAAGSALSGRRSAAVYRAGGECLLELIAREAETIRASFCKRRRMARHARFGNTIFHLEPNVKEAPGGLRDHHAAQWSSALGRIRGAKTWPSSGDLSPDVEVQAAVEFMTATRCFLHLRAHRDDNILSWHAQDEAGAKIIGLETGGTADAAYWMRTYYRHARPISRSGLLCWSNRRRRGRSLLASGADFPSKERRSCWRMGASIWMTRRRISIPSPCCASSRRSRTGMAADGRAESAIAMRCRC